MPSPEPFNPLDKLQLAETVANALLAQPPTILSDLVAFPGAGIYAIYYIGDCIPAYTLIAERNRDGKFQAPIYVGKAVPSGARKGVKKRARGTPLLESISSGPLHKRLLEHADSLQHATNLAGSAFYCRYLVLDDIWIPLGESLLIDRFKPVWNLVVDGFGIHDPGQGRHKQKRSSWDVIHPGRPWAVNLAKNPKTEKSILDAVFAFLAGKQVETVDDPRDPIEDSE